MNWLTLILVVLCFACAWKPVCSETSKKITGGAVRQNTHYHHHHQRRSNDVEMNKRSRRPHKFHGIRVKKEKAPKFLDNIINRAVSEVLSSMAKETKGRLASLSKPNTKRNIAGRPTTGLSGNESNAKTNTTLRPTTANDKDPHTKRTTALRPTTAQSNNNESNAETTTVTGTTRGTITTRRQLSGFTNHGDLPDPFEGSETPISEYTYKIDSDFPENSDYNVNDAYQGESTAMTRDGSTLSPLDQEKMRELFRNDGNFNDEESASKPVYGETSYDSNNKQAYQKTAISDYHKNIASSRSHYNYLNLNVFSRNPAYSTKKLTRKTAPKTTAAKVDYTVSDDPDQSAVAELNDDNDTNKITVDTAKNFLANSTRAPSSSSLHGNSNSTMYKEDEKTGPDKSSIKYKQWQNTEERETKRGDEAESKDSDEADKGGDTTEYKQSKKTASKDKPANKETVESDKTERKESDKSERKGSNKTELKENEKTERNGSDKSERKESNESERKESDKTERKENDKTERKESDKTERKESDKTERKESDKTAYKQEEKSMNTDSDKTAYKDTNKDVSAKVNNHNINSTLDLNEVVDDMKTVISTAFGKNASAYKHVSDYEVVVEKSVDNKKHININEPDFSVSIALNSSTNRDKKINTLQNVIKMLNDMKFKEEVTEAKHAIIDPKNITTKTANRETSTGNATREESDFSYIVHGGDVYKVIKMPNDGKAEWTKTKATTDGISNKEKQIISNLLDTTAELHKAKSETGAINTGNDDNHMIMHEEHDSEAVDTPIEPLITKFNKDTDASSPSSSIASIQMKDVPISRGHTTKYHHWSLVPENITITGGGEESAHDDELSYLLPTENSSKSKQIPAESETKSAENGDNTSEYYGKAVDKVREKATSIKKLQQNAETTGEAIIGKEVSTDVLQRKPVSSTPSKHANGKQPKQKNTTSYYVKQNGKHFKVDVLTAAKSRKPNSNKAGHHSSVRLEDGKMQQESKTTDVTQLQQQQQPQAQPQEFSENTYEIKHNNKIYKITEIPDGEKKHKDAGGRYTLPISGGIVSGFTSLGSGGSGTATTNIRPIFSVTGDSRTAAIKAQQQLKQQGTATVDNNANKLLNQSSLSLSSPLQTPPVSTTGEVMYTLDPKTGQAIPYTEQEQSAAGVSMLQSAEAFINNNKESNAQQQIPQQQNLQPTLVATAPEISTSGLVPAERAKKLEPYFPIVQQQQLLTHNGLTSADAAQNSPEMSAKQPELSMVDAKNIAHLETIIRKDPPSIMHDSASIIHQSNIATVENKHKQLQPMEQLISYNYAPANLTSNAGFSESFNKTLYEEVML